ncbi:putative ABC transporter permease subunit [Natronospora cellulosivora (SeqCode)]
MLKTLLKKDIMSTKNTYFKTKGLTSLLVGFILAIIAISLLSKQFIARLEPLIALTPKEHLIFLSFIFFIITLFTNLFIEARKKYYFSPELKLLIPTPIPTKTFFLYLFIKNTCLMPLTIVMGILLFILPILISIGVNTEASFFYYIAILPIIYSIMVIFSSISISFMMYISSVFSVKIINKFLLIISIITTIIFIGFLFFFTMPSIEVFFNWIEKIYGVLEILFFPVKIATDMLYLLINEIELLTALKYLVYLLLISILIFKLSVYISLKLYYRGYDKVQSLNSKIKNRAKAINVKKYKLFADKIFNYNVRTEWKKAYRNKEMMNGSLSFILLMILYIFSQERLSNILPWSNIQTITHIGVIGFLCSAAVVLLFLPFNIILQDSLKNQYWIFKVSPIKGSKYIFDIWFSQFFLQSLFSGVVLTITFLILNYNFITILVSLIIMFILISTFGLIKLTMNLLEATQNNNSFTIIQKVIINILPFVYYIFSLGILAFSQIYSDISYLTFIHNLNPNIALAISIVLFLLISCFSIYYSFKYGNKFWKKIEF